MTVRVSPAQVSEFLMAFYGSATAPSYPYPYPYSPSVSSSPLPVFFGPSTVNKGITYSSTNNIDEVNSIYLIESPGSYQISTTVNVTNFGPATLVTLWYTLDGVVVPYSASSSTVAGGSYPSDTSFPNATPLTKCFRVEVPDAAQLQVCWYSPSDNVFLCTYPARTAATLLSLPVARPAARPSTMPLMMMDEEMPAIPAGSMNFIWA